MVPLTPVICATLALVDVSEGSAFPRSDANHRAAACAAAVLSCTGDLVDPLALSGVLPISSFGLWTMLFGSRRKVKRSECEGRTRMAGEKGTRKRRDQGRSCVSAGGHVVVATSGDKILSCRPTPSTRCAARISTREPETWQDDERKYHYGQGGVFVHYRRIPGRTAYMQQSRTITALSLSRRSARASCARYRRAHPAQHRAGPVPGSAYSTAAH